MRVNFTTLFAITLLALAASPSILAIDPKYTSWNDAQLHRWLIEHDIPIGHKPATHEKLLVAVQNSWDSVYDKWSDADLKSFLRRHHVIAAPKSKREELIESARAYSDYAADRAAYAYNKYSGDLQESWGESDYREWLLRRGVISPATKGEQLRLLAIKKQSELAASAASATDAAAATASAAYQTVADAASYVTGTIEDSLEDARDYVWSTWDDNQLRSYLEEHNIIKTKSQLRRDQLMQKMRDAYSNSVNYAYESWNDSVLRWWLISHGVVKTDFQASRDEMLNLMKDNYYSAKDTVFDSWEESDMRDWAIQHNLIDKDAKYRRRQLERLVTGKYNENMFQSAWKDTEMRQWLIDNNIIKSDAKLKKDEYAQLMKENYAHYMGKTEDYLSWSDSRLRAWLREHDIDPPKTRDELLHTVRTNYVRTQGYGSHQLSRVYSAVKDALYSGVDIAEDQVLSILDTLKGGAQKVETQADKKKVAVVEKADHVKEEL